MKRMILFSGLLCVLAFVVEARDWGFSKDTVYESSVGWEDAVSLINQGSDTLKLDSVVAEKSGALGWNDLYFAYQPPTMSMEGWYCQLSEDSRTSCGLKGGGIAADSSLMFRNFIVWQFCPASKASAEGSGFGDTVEVRLRAVSSQMEEDTLLVRGRRCPTSSISPYRPPNLIKGEVPGRDILGRFSPHQTSPALFILSE